MLKITKVHGPVLVDRRKERRTELATAGLSLGVGEYVIATTERSNATVVFKGQKFMMGRRSLLRIRGSKVVSAEHREHFRGDADQFLGRVWQRVARHAQPVEIPEAGMGPLV